MMRKCIMGRVFFCWEIWRNGKYKREQGQMNIFAVRDLADCGIETEKRVERIFRKYKIYILYNNYTIKIQNSFKAKNGYFRQGRLWEVKRAPEG